MSPKLLSLIAALLSLIATGNALKCYTCLGSESSDCQKGTASSVVQNCDHIFPNSDYSSSIIQPFMSPQINNARENDIIQHCVQVTLEKGFETPYVYRTCGYTLDLEGVDDICEIIGLIEPARNCKSCQNDHCNNSPVSNKTINY